MAGINIDADLGVKGFLKGTNDMEKALEGVSDELEIVAKDGDKSLEKLSDKLKEAQKAAEKAGDGIQKSIGGGTKKGAAEAVDATEVVQKEAVANLSETVSSFDGTVSSFGDAIQGTLGGIIQDLSGMGLALGVAGAIGVGYLIKEFEKAELDAEKMKERIAAIGEQLIDTGDISLEFIIDQMKGLATETEAGVTNLKDLKGIADRAGESLGALAAAYAGDTKGLKDFVEQKKKQLQNEKDYANALKETKGANDQAALAAQGNSQATQVYVQKLEQAAAAAEQAQETEKAWLEAGGKEMQTKQGLVSAINDAYDTLAGSVEEFTDKESKVFDVEGYIKAMQEREIALKNYQTSITTSGLSQGAIDFLNSQGFEAADAMLKGYQKQGPAAKEELNRIWEEASKKASGSVETELDSVIKAKREASITATVDKAKAEEELRSLTASKTVRVNVDWRDTYGRPVN